MILICSCAEARAELYLTRGCTSRRLATSDKSVLFSGQVQLCFIRTIQLWLHCNRHSCAYAYKLVLVPCDGKRQKAEITSPSSEYDRLSRAQSEATISSMQL